MAETELTARQQAEQNFIDLVTETVDMLGIVKRTTLMRMVESQLSPDIPTPERRLVILLKLEQAKEIKCFRYHRKNKEGYEFAYYSKDVTIDGLRG